MLIPFVYTQTIRDGVIDERDNTVKSINLTNITITHYNNTKAQIDSLHKRINESPAEIELFVASRVQIAPKVLNSSNDTRVDNVSQSPIIPLDIEKGFTVCNIFANATEEKIQCEVNTQVQFMFADYDRLINRAIEELKAIDDSSQRVIDLQGLEIGAKNLTSHFKTALSENPKFWKTFQSQGDFFLEIDKRVKEFWTTYGSQIDTEIQNLQVNLDKFSEYKKHLENKTSELDEQQKEIKKRLDEFESPIGKLRIGFDDLITFFPAGLLAAFLAVVSILVDTIIIRNAYYNWYTINGYTPPLNREDIITIAPLWIDPKDRKQNKPIRWLIVFSPATIFFVSVGIIIFSWSLADTSLGGAPPYRPLALSLYLVSGLFVTLINYERIKRAIAI